MHAGFLLRGRVGADFVQKVGDYSSNFPTTDTIYAVTTAVCDFRSAAVRL